MATFTTNYNLKKPDGTDFYNIEDFNSNADIIDAQLKAAYDLINDNAGSFKNMGINGVNIDEVFDYSYVVGLTGSNYGTRPEEAWVTVINFCATNFIVQIAMRTQNGGAASDNRMWIRNKYSSGTWSGWSDVFSAGNPPTAAQVGAAAESTHKLKTYTDVTQLGLTAATATVDGILQAMPDGAQAIIVLSTAYSTSEFPTQYGTLTVHRSDISRGYAMVVEKSNTPNIWYKGFNQTSWGSWFTLYSSAKPQVYIQSDQPSSAPDNTLWAW